MHWASWLAPRPQISPRTRMAAWPQAPMGHSPGISVPCFKFLSASQRRLLKVGFREKPHVLAWVSTTDAMIATLSTRHLPRFPHGRPDHALWSTGESSTPMICGSANIFRFDSLRLRHGVQKGDYSALRTTLERASQKSTIMLTRLQGGHIFVSLSGSAPAARRALLRI